MARVNLENHLFSDPRLIILGAYLKNAPSILDVCHLHSIGMLALLWHSSQSEQISIATGDQIKRWTLHPKNDEVLWALEGAGFIRCLENDQWEIVGNEKQIEVLKSRNIKATNAANTRWRKDSKKESADAPSISNTNSLISYSSSCTTKYKYKNKKSNTRQLCEQSDANQPEAEKVKIDRTDYDGFMRTWNDNRGRLSACEKLTDERKKKIKSRLAQNHDLEYWAGVIRRFSQSNFACEGSWAGIDFLIRNDTNVLKIMEGKYDNKRPEGSIAMSFGEIWEKAKKERGL